MQDTIILGNGTSKQIKTASLPNSYAEFKAMAENGNLFADIKLNVDGCEVVGTPLNKLNLLTDETAGILGNAENVDEALQNTQKTINGIPVDLTGIYNTQVIGYDETQGKLVPMMNVARTETVLPNSEIPVPWEWDLTGVPAWMGVAETSTNVPELVNISTTETADIHFFVKSTKPYLISEYTVVTHMLNRSSNVAVLSDTFIEFSKDKDFNTIEASFQCSLAKTESNISSLIGNYYWRLNASIRTNEGFSANSQNIRFDTLSFSQGGTT